MKKVTIIRPYFSILAACVLFVSACALPFGTKDDKTTSTDTPAATATVTDAVIDELSANLVASGDFTAAEATVIADAARRAVSDASGLDQNDLSASLPVALLGAERGLSDASLSLSQDERIAGVSVIVSSFVASLNGRFESTSGFSLSSRAIATDAATVTALLAKISQAAVANLKLTGIETARLGDAAGSVVVNMIGSLGEGGVNKAVVSEALVQITKNAVSSLKDAGLTASDALAATVQAVTAGAVAAVPTIGTQGVEISDYATLADSIANGAASAVSGISSSVTDVAALASAVAKGSSAGIASLSQTLDGDTVASMVQAATQGATAGILGSTYEDAPLDSAAMIGAITAAATQTLAASDTIDQGSAQKAVTVGAAAAAQTVATGAMSAEDLANAIVILDESGTEVETDAEDIAEGISVGSNEAPVVSAGDDQSVAVGAAVTLTGTAADDTDGTETLTVKWAFASMPSGSSATLSSSNALSTGFTPDIAGTYLLELTVTDSQKAAARAYVAVIANKDAGVSVYDGMTAQERLDAAILSLKAGDAPAARDKLLVILAHYTESAIFAEVNYYLAAAYGDLGNNAMIKARLEAALTYADAGTVIGAKARVWYASFLTWTLPDLTKAKTVANEVIAARAGTAEEADALDVLAGAMRAGGDVDGAISTITTQVLTHAMISNERTFWAHQNLAWAYAAKENWSLALSEFSGLQDRAIPNADTDTTVGALRFNGARNLWWFVNNAADATGSGITVLTDGIPVMEGLAEDTSLEAKFRLNAARLAAEFYLWNSDNTAVTYQKAIDTVQAALDATADATDIPARTQRSWCLLRLGQGYDNLADEQLSEATRATLYESAIDAYDACQAIGWGAWYGNRPAAEAMAQKAGDLHWNTSLSDRDDTALALTQAVVASYPADLDQYPKAYAYFRMGEIYRDIGNDWQDQSGMDYEASYLRAIAAFAKVTTAYFPKLSATTWYFLQVNRQIADCYMEMRNYDTARTYLYKSINDGNVSQSEKAWAQLYLGDCWGEEAMLLVQEGEFDAAYEMLTVDADAEYRKVSDYTDESDSSKPINDGKQWARALRDEGRYLREAGRDIRYDQGAERSVWAPFHEAAIPFLERVVPANFPDLPVSEGWIFVDALSKLSDCQFQLGDYEEGRAALENLIAAMEAGTAPDADYWGVREDLAKSYHREAENVWDDYPDGETSTLQAMAISLEETCVSLIGDILADWKVADSLTDDQNAQVAQALNEAGWATLNAINALGWDNAGAGDNGFSTADWAKIDGYIAALEDMQNELTSNSALADSYGGGNAAGMARIFGHIYATYANGLGDGTDYADRKTRFDLALDSFQAAIDNPGCSNDDLAASMSDSVWIRLEYARYLDVLAERIDAFETAFDLTASLISNPDAYIESVAGACVNLGWAYWDLHEAFAGQGVTGMEETDSWQTSIRFFVQAIADHTDNYAELGDGWEWERAYDLMSELDPDEYPPRA